MYACTSVAATDADHCVACAQVIMAIIASVLLTFPLYGIVGLVVRACLFVPHRDFRGVSR